MLTRSDRRPRMESRWGHQAARAWGDCERRIHLGGRVYPDGGRVVDGWPPVSPCAQWKDGEGVSHRQHRQRFLEVFETQEALLVSRVLVNMPASMRCVLWLVYVEGRGAAKRVREEAGMGRDRFYNTLATALDMIESGQDKSG